jgi:hypothetical protein
MVWEAASLLEVKVIEAVIDAPAEPAAESRVEASSMTLPAPATAEVSVGGGAVPESAVP